MAAENGIAQMLRVRHRLDARRKARRFLHSKQDQDSGGAATNGRFAHHAGRRPGRRFPHRWRNRHTGIDADVGKGANQRDRPAHGGGRPARGHSRAVSYGGYHARAWRMARGLDRRACRARPSLLLAAHWKVAISRVDAACFSLGTVLVAGIGFGTYPARKASLIPPIRALQVE